MTTRPRLHTIQKGDGPPVVLVHGFTQTARSWDVIAADLARDHRVIAVDAPGHGASGDVQADLWDGARLLGQAGGAACYIEGTDQGGMVAYRFLLTYGGKRLMCHGSLYKDKDSAALGDLRDKVLMQAKKICETLAL